MKSIPKTNILFNFYCNARQKSKYKYINRKTAHPVSLTFFQVSVLSILVCSSFLCLLFRLFRPTNGTVSRVAFAFHLKAGSKSCSIKLLFSYPPQVFF